MLLLEVKLHHLLEAPRFPPAFLEDSFPINAVCFLHTEFSVEVYRQRFVNVSAATIATEKLKDAWRALLTVWILYCTDC
jgi:hypothetical protein